MRTIKNIILLLLLLPSLSLASTWNNLTWCKYNFYISWPDFTRINYSINYKINWIKDITWKVIRNNKAVVKSIWNIFSYSFKQPWKIKLIANFKYKNCNLSATKNIEIYKKVLLTINSENNFLSKLPLKEKNILIKNINLENLNNLYIVKIANRIFVPSNYVIKFFNKITSSIENKNIVLLIWHFKWFYSKVVIPYIKDLKNTKVYIYDNKEFLNVISDIFQNNQLSNKNLISIDNKSWNNLPLSYFVNKLIEYWIWLDVVWLVFVAIFWILLIAFFRQIIWFSSFWVYTPLIFSILIVMFWYKLTLTLFIISLLSNIITYLITKKIYILYGSKISLNYTIYTIISISFARILADNNLFSLSKISLSVVLLFLILPSLTKNLVKEDTKLFSKSFIIFITEFIIITSTLLFLFNLNILKYTLIAYPDLLWLIGIASILIGRFTWLQLLEYIRFAPLIKKSLYEEE